MKVLFSILTFCIHCFLAACSQDGDGLDNLRVSGDMTTVISTGNMGHYQQSRMRTGMDF